MLSTAVSVFWVVGTALSALTIIEYIVAVEMSNNGIPLAVMALLKAALILYFFMHVYRLWRPEGSHQ